MAESADATTALEPDAKPHPPRYWWLKRLALAAAVFLLALLGLRWWWGCEAERRLQAKIAEYRAAGQPVLLEDFMPEPIPDEENGAHFLQLAASKITQPAGVSVQVDFLVYDPQLCSDHLDDVHRIIQANQEALELVRAARSKSAADWKVPLSAPAFFVPLPDLSSQRRLAKLTSVAVLYHHLRADDAAAIETVRDGLGIARHVNDVSPFTLIVHLVANAIDSLGVMTLEGIVHNLDVWPERRPVRPNGRPATRAQVQALIRELLDEQALQARWAAAMYGERLCQMETGLALSEGRLNLAFLMTGGPPAAAPLRDRATAFVLGPAWKLDVIRMMEYTTAYAHAGAAPSWPAARARLPAHPLMTTGAESVSRSLSSLLLPSFEGAPRWRFCVLAERRMAATALAIRLYELDHGSRPTTLADLVPEYLPAVPHDPLVAEGAEIRYLPDAAQPLLYSVSLNGTDEGGAFGRRAEGSVDWREQDMPFFLNGDRPRPPPRSQPARGGAPPATQPASAESGEDDRDIEHAQRDEHSEQP